MRSLAIILLSRFFPLLYVARRSVTGLYARLCIVTRSMLGSMRLRSDVNLLPRRTCFDIRQLNSHEGLNLDMANSIKAGNKSLGAMPIWSSSVQYEHLCRANSRLSWIDSYVAELERACLIGPDGVVVTSEGTLLPELCRRPGPRPSRGNPLDHPVYHRLLPGRPTDFPGTSFVLSASSPDVYHHWLLDVVPKIERIDPSHVDRIFIGGKDLNFKRETLAATGLSHIETHFLGEQGHRFSRPKRLLAVSEMCGGFHFPPHVLAYLRSLFAYQHDPSRPRIFFDRSDAARRKISCPGYHKVLLDRGFTIVDAGELTVREQATIMQNASIVVGIHGSALANLVFANQTSVIELLPAAYANPLFFKLATAMNLPYAAIVGEGRVMESRNVLANVEFSSANQLADLLDDALERFQSWNHSHSA